MSDTPTPPDLAETIAALRAEVDRQTRRADDKRRIALQAEEKTRAAEAQLAAMCDEGRELVRQLANATAWAEAAERELATFKTIGFPSPDQPATKWEWECAAKGERARAERLAKALEIARQYFQVRAQNTNAPTPTEMVSILEQALTPPGAAEGGQMSDLLPCPWCGGDAFVDATNCNCRVGCSHCQLRAGRHNSVESAIAHWNTRAELPPRMLIDPDGTIKPVMVVDNKTLVAFKSAFHENQDLPYNEAIRVGLTAALKAAGVTVEGQ